MYDGTEEPTGSYEISKAEGDVLFKRGDYRKAVESFTTALGFLNDQSPDKNKLVTLFARSKCYMELGEPDKALIDANETLVDDPNFVMGLLQKAEAYYQQANFEMALIFYHRGNNLRPEVQDFRIGIEKAQEAIDNSIGGTAAVKLENKGDLSFFNDEKPKKVQPKKKVEIKEPAVRRVRACDDQLPEETREEKKTIRQLLGDLYSDREYLRQLLKEGQAENTTTSETGRSICNLVCNGLSYLDERMAFWQQQQRSFKSGKELKQWSVDNIKAIERAYASGRYRESLKQAKQMLTTVENWSAEEMKHAPGHPTQLVFPNKAEVLGDLHNYIGSSSFELGRNKMALFHYERDLEIAKKRKAEDAKSRALVNLGRMYAKMHQYEKAIDAWNEKSKLSTSPLESTWLCHEIGKCYLEMGINEQKKSWVGLDVDYFKQARNYGAQSKEWATQAADDVWQLNAGVLVAQSCVKLNDLQAALDQFKSCLDLAKQQEDKPAEIVISNAIEDLNKHMQREESRTPASEGTKEEERQQEENRKEKSPETEATAQKKVATPQQGAESPQQGAESPQQGAESPQQGAESPQQEAESPQQGAESPQHGVAIPQQGAATPENGVASPEQGSTSPQQEAANPEGPVQETG